jgi:CRP/FNR family transcriptional regulator, cyclic AMP receptor protein
MAQKPERRTAMAQIELKPVEMELLQEILKRYLSELAMEIAHSHRKDFREFLKKRREFMEDFIQRLGRELGSAERKTVSMDRIRKVEILEGLSELELQSMVSFFREENLDSGVSLCQEGSRADQLYVLEQGSVSIRSHKHGQLEIATPGRIVGWSFLVPPYRYTASAVTTAPSQFLVIKTPDFYSLIHREPQMGVKVMNNLAQIMASRFKGPEDSSNP